MITKRRFVSWACAGGLAAICPKTIPTVAAQTVSRMLVGFGAGGAIDVIARMLVDGMKDYSPSFIVDNRPGAGGRLALVALKGGPADGTAMILTPASSVAVFPHVYKTLGYDAFKDFAPVTTVCSFPFLITVGPMVPADVRTLADFVKWCAANPKQATYGSAAAGSMLHFTGVTLAKAGRFEFVHLPYGGPGGIQDLIGGRIAATIYPIGTALPHVQSGAIRALATTGPQRSPRLLDVPTVREAGYPALEANEWFGVFVPANTPTETVSQLNAAIRTVVNAGAFKTALAKLSVDPAGETPEEFALLIKSDFDRWGSIVQASGFMPED
ncbi:tripartite tricarboxylate transporter substrate-binding protein [Bradyrhizobium murdochi]|uniref:tripartite tricarboxylate transporter substrate-binding protein n=1 Tax=Bradyrhizobium murdochi TaxID=1038859 RepID=UPI000485289A|nr:tripartite tricarboxylate transporter substrate-binding protein [Bradyrhizobium murdochi]